VTIEVRRIEENVGWVDATGLPAGVISGTVEGIGRELARWVDGQRAATQRLTLFDRTAYAAPDNPFAQLRIARDAVKNDDVVGGVADVTEGLIFQGVKWEADNADDADVFNQISRDIDLDNLVRVFHREDFTYSQVIMGVWWGRKEYKVRGYNVQEPKPEKETDPITGKPVYTPQMDDDTGKPKKPKKVKRKKTYDVVCPLGFTFLDPLRVVPLSPGPFGQDVLAWQAEPAEYATYDRLLNGEIVDPVMERFFLAKYTPDRAESDQLVRWGVDPKRLIILNPDNVFRITRTKPSYARWPDLRMRSVFQLLDLKQQLIEADRVSLVGAANYILLVKKGTKDDPATQPEIDNLKENFKVIAKLPVIVGDHRLEIEIITPDQEFVLNNEKYDVLDRRIISRCMGAMSVASSGQRNESTLTIARGVARLLESRRHMMKRALEKHIARAMVEHPFNKDKFEDEPNLAFTPRNVQLDSDAQITQAVMALRTQKELSRESILEYFGFDQEVEAQRREYEEESGLDAIFGTSIPFNSPLNAQGQPQVGPNGAPPPPQVTGGQGGRPPGGGQTPQSPAKATKPKAPSGNPARSAK
jgi:hypothetical protein